MHGLWRYTREHPWQSRLLGGLLSVILAVAAAWLAWPRASLWYAIRLMDSPAPAMRHRGVDLAVRTAGEDRAAIARIQRHLPAAPDRQFLALSEALGRLEAFGPGQTSPAQLDRWRALNLAAAAGHSECLPLRRALLHALVLDGRDNAFVRSALATTLHDSSSEVRARSAILAAGLADDAALAGLLGDTDAGVRIAALRGAAMTDRTALLPAVRERLQRATDPAELTQAAYALATLAGPPAWDSLQRLLAEHASGDAMAVLGVTAKRGPAATAATSTSRAAPDGTDLPDQLLLALDRCDRPRAAAFAVALVRAADANRPATTMAYILAAGAPRQELAPTVQRDLDAALHSRRPIAPLVYLAGHLELSAEQSAAVQLQLAELIARRWQPENAAALILAADAIAKLAARAPATGLVASSPAASSPASAPLPATASDWLSQAAFRTDIPPASAAAAAALLAMGDPHALDAVEWACQLEDGLAGDIVAWRVWQLAGQGDFGRRQARAALERLLQPSYNANARSAAAMLLALMAANTPEQARAADALRKRLADEHDAVAAGSYQCALLMLGDAARAPAVLDLLRTQQFPKGRVLTALLLAGRGEAAEVVLGDVADDPARIDSLLAGRLLAGVFAQVCPGLPRYDLAAGPAVRQVQAERMRDFYLLSRRQVADK